MSSLKQIVLEQIDIYTIFPEFLTHCFVAEGLLLAISKEWGNNGIIVGAGHCYMNDGYGWDVESDSTSLYIVRTESQDMHEYNAGYY